MITELDRNTQSPILGISHLFSERQFPDSFSDVHWYMFKLIGVTPLTPALEPVELKYRWKLSPEQNWRVGRVFEGRYCNDMVGIFNWIAEHNRFDARIAKVFSTVPEDGTVKVHSLSLIDYPAWPNAYVVNSGSQKNYWIEPLSREAPLTLGSEMPHGWTLWKVGKSQDEMGLNTWEDEDLIIKDALSLKESS